MHEAIMADSGSRPIKVVISDGAALKSNDRVAILMCTYNGSLFLSEQIKSFERQTHHNWNLYVSDDGSQDSTLDILQMFSEECGGGRVQVFRGPQLGFAANFLSLTCRSEVCANFYAWSDQDDIWEAEKLKQALVWLRTIPSEIPALYCGRTKLVCEAGLSCGYSPKFHLPPRFSNALVQNIGGGNTMVFNQAARAVLQEAGDSLVIPSHDWWAYQLITGVGGKVFYDPVPMVQYRQHNRNIIGSNSTWLARFKRICMVFQGRFGEWSEQNIRALEASQHLLTAESRKIFYQFKSARNQKIFRRIFMMKKAGLYRQTVLGNCGLALAILLKKI